MSNNFKFYKKITQNFDIKTFERPKNIKESNDSLFINYWNETKQYIYIYIYMTKKIKKYKKKIGLHSKE